MEDCIFCKIVKKEIGSTIVYEDEEILAFKDIHPVTPIHILVIPKKHISSAMEVSKEDQIVIGKMFLVIQKLAKQLGIEEKGFRIINNCGEDGGQEVQHFHFHLLAGTKLGTKLN